MKSKFKIILISFFVIMIILFILSIFIYNRLKPLLGIKYNKTQVITKYKEDKTLFIKSVDEIIICDKNLYFNKFNSGITIGNNYSKNSKLFENLSNEELDKYENTLKVINDPMIKSIIKIENNIEFSISSPYGLDQYIVYLQDEKSYKFGRKIINKYKIDKYWYYIEAEK